MDFRQQVKGAAHSVGLVWTEALSRYCVFGNELEVGIRKERKKSSED